MTNVKVNVALVFHPTAGGFFKALQSPYISAHISFALNNIIDKLQYPEFTYI